MSLRQARQLGELQTTLIHDTCLGGVAGHERFADALGMLGFGNTITLAGGDAPKTQHVIFCNCELSAVHLTTTEARAALPSCAVRIRQHEFPLIDIVL